MSQFTAIVPKTSFKMRVRDESIGGDNPYRWESKTSSEIFANKKVIVFSLPGAFTPTCSSTHVPRFDELYESFLNLGVDEIYCLSVNDAFVMNQWGRHLGIVNLKLLPDGNGEFTRKMGMLVDKNNLGFGARSWRYSMLVDNQVIEKMFVEAGFSDNCETDPFETSDADTLMAWLKGEDLSTEKPARREFAG